MSNTVVNMPVPVAQPLPLNPHTDEAGWKRWRWMFEAYGRVTQLQDKDPEEQMSHGRFSRDKKFHLHVENVNAS